MRQAPVSMLSQLLFVIDRAKVKLIAAKHQVEKHAKGFTTWSHFVCMLFVHLAQVSSLRDVTNGLAGIKGKLNHLGILSPPKKSTLAYANANRTCEFFKELFDVLYTKISNITCGSKKKFHFKNPLFSIDSTIIELCLNIFDWALYKTTKGAVKLHLLLEHANYLPCWAMVSKGKEHDVKFLNHLSFLPKGAIVVMDRGYVSFRHFYSFILKGIFFVTRSKINMKYEVIKDHVVPLLVGRPSNSTDMKKINHVVSDQTISLTGPKAQKDCPSLIRLVTFWDAEGQREFKFITNNFKLAAITICKVYKDRWAIESFFKAIKQNLKIKSFLGTSQNAVEIQLWTALIAILLIKYMEYKSKYSWSLANLITAFRLYMMIHMDLWDWLDDPRNEKEPPPKPKIISFSLFDPRK
jgi:hypothetical protein